MASIDLQPSFVWLLVAVLGAGIYAMRLSFIHLYGLIATFPPRVERALTFIPAAILAALVTPVLFPLDGSLAGMVFNVHALAGALALITALRTESMIATIGVGMGVLWTATLLLG